MKRTILRDKGVAFGVVGVGLSGYDRGALKVLLFRRRRDGPFQAGRSPWIGTRFATPKNRPAEIKKRKNVGDGQDGRACRRQQIPRLPFGRIGIGASRHTEIAQHKLWKKG